MINNITKWINGYVKDYICGDNKERFVTLCKNNDLRIYKICQEKDKFVFQISVDHYKKIKKIVRKTHIIPVIMDRCGLPFVYYNNKNKKSLLLGAVIGMTLFYIASLFIWNITIEGENYYTDYEIIKFLKENNICTGMRKNKINCSETERLLRKKYNEIGWVSVRVEGTYMIIKIKENIIMNSESSKTEQREDIGMHIIAHNNGKIKSIVTRQGDALVNKGDEVKKKDILISGISTIEDTGGNVLKKKGICADGDIVIEYNKEYFYECSRKYVDRYYTGRKNIGLFIRNDKYEVINIKYLPLLTKKFDNYDVIVNNYNVVVCKNLYMPINFVIKKEFEYKSKVKEYTDKELIQKARCAFERYKVSLKNNNMECVRANIDMNISKKGIHNKGYITIQDRNIVYKKEKID